MSSTGLCAVILLACALAFSDAQTSCKGRCGSDYYRGNMCQCDYNCLTYQECCKDYESQCTTRGSCKGRCGESFKRGRMCSCDPNCVKYKQCCPDYSMYCDTEEEINGAASATAPVKTNSCPNVNDNKPQEPSLDEETDPTFNEGNNEDDTDLNPPVSPTSYPQDDLSDDMYGQVFPTDVYPDNGVDDPEASPIPESTSGYGVPTADPMDQIPTEPTQDADAPVSSQTEMTPSDNEPTKDSPVNPTEGADAGDPTSSLPQPTMAGDHVSSQPTPTTASQTGVPPTAGAQLDAAGQEGVQLGDDILNEAQNADPTGASDKLEVTTSNPTEAPVPAGATEDSADTANSQVTATPAASTVGPTSIPEATTSNPDLEATENNAEDVTAAPPTSVADPQPSDSPVEAGDSDLDAPATPVPTSADASQDDTADKIPPGGTTAGSPKATTNPTDPSPPEATTKPQDKPEPAAAKPTPAKPASKPGTKPLAPVQTVNTDDPRNYQGDDSNDTNLCSGRPVSGVTTLRNGTMVVFRGHYFWTLDRNRVPSPARGITETWGVPSPIDTVFTRCNCQGKTYILRGTKYWRFENDVLDHGYPKAIQTGFDGLRGHITAALSVPQYRTRRESVYFFKRGGTVQKYSYQFGTSPSCGRKPNYTVYTVRNRMVRQAVSYLEPSVNIRTSWRGFPSTITAAVSVPSNREPEGYKYYVFSRSKSYNVRMDGERPAVAASSANEPPQSNNFFKCPKKV